MITQNRTGVEAFEIGDTEHLADFTIDKQDFAKIAEILRKSTYSDEISAVIREISTNAADAHVEAGIPNTPIQVTLPSSINSEFSVRDFGKGMSREKMIRVFSRYGASTKNHDNSQTGGFGIGCKSPFAYGDNFVVTCFCVESDELKYKTVYNAILCENGCGKIVVLSKELTDEPTGVLVTVSVKESDIYNFRVKATNIYKFFKVTPVIDGGNFKINKFEGFQYSKENEWAVRREDISRWIMGNVAYPIDITHFKDIRHREILEYGINLFGNVGDVLVATSREALRYDENTINVISQRLDNALQDLEQEFVKGIENIQNLNDLSRYADSFSKGEKEFIHTLFPNLQWRGSLNIRASIHFIPTKDFDFNYIYKNKSFPLNSFKLNLNRNGRTFIIKDIDKISIGRIKYLYTQDEVVIINSISGDLSTLRAKFLDAYPIREENCINYSSIPKIPRDVSPKPYSRTQKSVYGKKLIKMKLGCWGHTGSDYWTSDYDLDSENPKLLLEIDRYEIGGGGLRFNNEKISRLTSAYNKCVDEEDAIEVYGCKSNFDKTDFPNRITLEEYFELLASNKKFAYRKVEKHIEQLFSKSSVNEISSLKSKFLEFYNKDIQENNLEGIHLFENLESYKKNLKEFNFLIEDFKTKYPLVSYLNESTPLNIVEKALTV